MVRFGTFVRDLPRSAVLAFTLLAWACGGSSPSPPDGGIPAGTIPVRGSERLAWDQAGDVSNLRFLAYVDGQPVSLDRATCDAAQLGPQGSPCVSPLPALSVGVHNIALSAVSRTSGLESAQSQAITVQKLAGLTASGFGSLSADDSDTAAAARTIPDTLTAADGLTFGVQVLASGVEAPAQIALAPDGRLFVADVTGRVWILDSAEGAAPSAPRTTDQSQAELALAFDASTMLDPPPAGPLGLSLHPGFARNRFVYVAYVALDRRDQGRLLVVRLREAGDTLGEPAVLFDEPLAAVPADGPRLAFGPDRLLYVALPEAVELPPQASAGASGGAILRFGDDGRLADRSAVYAYGLERPVAFGWDPDTGALWGVLADGAGRATMRAIDAGEEFGLAGCRGTATERCAGATRTDAPPLEVGRSLTPGGLVFYRYGAATKAPRALRAFVALPGNASLWRVTPGDASRTEILLSDSLGRIGDIVSDDRGALFIATRNRDGRGTVAESDDLVLRLTPRAR